MALAMEKNEPFDPADIALLRPERIVAVANYIADAVKDFDLARLSRWG